MCAVCLWSGCAFGLGLRAFRSAFSAFGTRSSFAKVILEGVVGVFAAVLVVVVAVADVMCGR